MFPLIHSRAGHYLLLTVAWAALSLTNLGQPSLWDIDEGNNAEAAREMYVSGNWIVPTFNYELRVDKPALLYWFQAGAYHLFGVNEFSARLPSALAALACLLLAYELGRFMFSAATGLLGALVLSTCLLFCGAAHFANPDALLNACTLLTFLFFWRDFERGGSGWLAWCGVSSGFAVLAKGPVGLVLPGSVIVLFLICAGQWRRCFRKQLLFGVLLFVLVAAPWYIWVGTETRGEFLKGFLLKHNVGRFLEPMENHGGPVVYYVVILLAGFAPWSIFFAATGWHAWKGRLPEQSDRPRDMRYRFLGCWMLVYLAFFTVSRTKLPNYVLPLYPPLALVTAHFLDRWRRGEVTPPAWCIHSALVGLVFMGLVTAVGLLIGGGAMGEALTRGRSLAGLDRWALLGAIPVVAALAAWWLLNRQKRHAVVVTIALSGVVFSGILAGWGAAELDQHKAPRMLGQKLRADLPDGEVLVGAYDYFQPSLVYYCQREVRRLTAPHLAIDHLRYPIPVFLFVPAETWEGLRSQYDGPFRVVARQRDLYRGCDILLIANY